jgi:glutamate 5-kinase
VEGPFERGDAIAIRDSEGRRIACGIASYGSSDIETIHGLRSERIEEVLGYQYGAEVVHRDNLVLL